MLRLKARHHLIFFQYNTPLFLSVEIYIPSLPFFIILKHLSALKGGNLLFFRVILSHFILLIRFLRVPIYLIGNNPKRFTPIL